MNKLKAELVDNARFEEQKADDEFAIHHYAGIIKYRTTGMIAKNKDPLPASMHPVMLATDNALVDLLFQEDIALNVGPWWVKCLCAAHGMTPVGGRGSGDGAHAASLHAIRGTQPPHLQRPRQEHQKVNEKIHEEVHEVRAEREPNICMDGTFTRFPAVQGVSLGLRPQLHTLHRQWLCHHTTP